MNFESYVPTDGLLAFILVLAIWSAVWKGFALYRAGRLAQSGWFVAMFILNTAGILEILYLFVFSKRAQSLSGESRP